jgi:hypothetical protein
VPLAEDLDLGNMGLGISPCQILEREVHEKPEVLLDRRFACEELAVQYRERVVTGIDAGATGTDRTGFSARSSS